MTVTQHSDKEVSDVEIESRTRRALEEYMTVLPEEDTGLCEVHTQSGSEYIVDAEDGACTCPDMRHNLGHDENCKHIRRARFALGLDAVPSDAVEELDVDENLGCGTDAELRFVASDGGIVEADDDAEILEEDGGTTGVRDPHAHRDDEDVDTTPLGTVVDDEEDADECDECAELSGLPCFECYMEGKGFDV
jgi:predicted nucleic acid-binding Zn finger protein